MIVLLLGIIVSIADFIFLQEIRLQLNIWFFSGIVLLIPLVFFRVYPRKVLIRAGFPNITSTARLQIVENHVLVKEGIYKYVRHPLYIGEILRTFWVQLILSSMVGLLFSVIAIFLLLIRIQIEERMLLRYFGEKYEEYKKSTEKLTPFIY